jgi:uncharacterized protein (UPF0548 family)
VLSGSLASWSDGAVQMLHRHRQPGLGVGKAAVLVVEIHGIGVRQPSRPLKFGPEADAVGVLQVLEGHIGLGQAQLLALVEADRAAQAHQQRGVKPRASSPRFQRLAWRITSWLENAQQAQPSPMASS